MWIWPIQCICFRKSSNHHSNTWPYQLLMYLSLDTGCVVEIYYQDNAIQTRNVRLFYDKSRTQHKTLVSDMKLWKSRRDKRLNCYRVINKITLRLLKRRDSSLKLTAAECVVSDSGWQLSTHLAAPSVPPKRDGGRKQEEEEQENLWV